MKITPRITELLFDLSELETSENNQYLTGDIEELRNNFLQLYRATDSHSSRETIIAITTEAGYPWFGRLAKASNLTVRDIPLKKAANEGQFMSDEDFLELLPANGHFH
ncbi:MAG: hypothetical protein ACJAYF_003318 [Arenicella sp.]|jgi:hypothetical protein